MPAPLPLVERLWRRFGFAALGIGLVLIGLIIYAAIFAYRYSKAAKRLAPVAEARPAKTHNGL